MGSMVKGSLLMTAEGLETAGIAEKDRDRKVLGFYDMKLEAERHHDRFYALEAVYNYPYSYGVFYPSFVNMSWQEFQECETLKGISQTTFELMQAFCQHPDIGTLPDKDAFQRKEEPHAYTGYYNPTGDVTFVNNLTDWENWHRMWYSTHQELIDWDSAGNDWLPRLDLVKGIFRRELMLVLGRERADVIEEDLVATEFYDKIMKHQGDRIEAYAAAIGREVCLSNYYILEPELSAMEQRRAGKLREIYSIINCQGRRQFISIDFRHGMFEFHNERGDHLGEFHFDGSFNTGIEADHALKCMDQWHRQTGR